MFVHDIFIDFINLSIFNQFTILLLPVVLPYSSPYFPNFINSLSNNNSSEKSGSYPTLFHPIYILLIY